MDAMRGWVSAPGIKSEVVLWAAERPAKATAMERERMMATVSCERVEQSTSV
jgi:hypothetical protein